MGHAVLSSLLFGACGDEYAHLAKIGIHSAAKPCGWKPWCSVEDRNAWLARARYAFKLVRTAWNSLFDLEKSLGQGYGHLKSHEGFVETYENDFLANDEEGSWYQVAGQSDEVIGLIANIEMAACALDRLNKSIVIVANAVTKKDGTPVYVPDVPVPVSPEADPLIPEGGLPAFAGGIGLALGAGLLVLILVMAGRK